MSPPRAVLEIAHRLGSIRDMDYRWLLHAIGGRKNAGPKTAGPKAERPKTESPKTENPKWDSGTGELILRNQQIRPKLRSYRIPSNIRKILDAFQLENWKSCIQN